MTYIKPSRINRIERDWDNVGFWDREMGFNLFDKHSMLNTSAYGMASLVHNDEELVFASGVDLHDTGEALQKAEFEMLDGEEEKIRGIVYPKRRQIDRGLILKCGPDLRNRTLLIGTALENADWKEVARYANGDWSGPLLPSSS